MADTLVTTARPTEVADDGCGCCRPPAAPTVADQVRELEDRRASVERRLAGLEGRQP